MEHEVNISFKCIYINLRNIELASSILVLTMFKIHKDDFIFKSLIVRCNFVPNFADQLVWKMFPIK